MSDDRRTLIAIVGRPNVGKSRLFNRLAEGNPAIVHDTEGVTRDRQYADGSFDGLAFTVIDTGGLIRKQEGDELAEGVVQQVELAIDQADVIVFVTDGRAGCLPRDEEIADMLRETDKPVVTAVNKVDEVEYRNTMTPDFYHLGLDLVPVSAEHNLGIDELMQRVADISPVSGQPVTGEDDERIDVAIVGKPNTGKSTLINRIIGQPRLLMSDEPGTTRDAIDLFVERDDTSMRFIDTAGLRKKSQVEEKLEEYAVIQSIQSVESADVAVLMVDAIEGVTNQLKKISAVVNNRDCGVIVAVNKWDLVDKQTGTAGQFVKYLRSEMPFLDFAPVVFLSALTGQRIPKLLDLIESVYQSYSRRIQTSQLNDFLQKCFAKHSPPVDDGRQVKIYYGSQVSSQPPTFLMYANYPDGIPEQYRRFLENQLRDEFDFEGAPLRIVFKER
jgi:GTP-binding protein